MLRRSHKKSRGGCLQCKQRHVKCDETRPACLLCAISERDCSYASQAQPENLSASSTSSYERPINPGDSHSQGHVTLPDISPLAAVSLPNTDSPERSSINNHQTPTLDEVINLNHMELLIHFILDQSMFNLSTGLESFPSSFPFFLKTGLESPYLLHQMLAFSAYHLAVLHPECSSSYLHQAATLQTRAISLFNDSWTEVDQSNCVPVLLFSTALGHHLFADTLAKRDPGGLEAFMSHCIRCLEIQRGIYTIASAAWPLLMESELEPILSMSSDFTSRAPRGNHSQRIRELVDGADGLREEEKEACRLAIKYLQVGFDVALAGEGGQGYRYQMLFQWTMLVPPQFTGLLAVKRPEALAVLGYYALLLHYGRNMWQVRDSGAYILGIILDYLGSEWDHWLEYPREMIAKDPG